MSSDIEVVIPVVNSDLARNLLISIDSGLCHPSKVIIVDNTPNKDFSYTSTKFPIQILYSESGGVNESWNIGISASCASYVSILNDDIVVSPFFLKKVVAGMKRIKKCGVMCPRTMTSRVIDWRNILRCQTDISYFAEMRFREGWAFTVIRDILNRAPAIPHKYLTTYCGDDWYWYWTYIFGYAWLKDMNNFIYHKVGASHRHDYEKYKAIRKHEKRLFLEIWNDNYGHLRTI